MFLGLNHLVGDSAIVRIVLPMGVFEYTISVATNTPMEVSKA